MIRAIFFDFDGVLTLNERGSTVTIQVIQETNPDVPASKIRDCYYQYHPALLLGEVTHLDIWSNFCQCIGKDIDPQILNAAFGRTSMNEAMLQLAAALVATNYRLGIITDNAADRMAYIIAQHGLDALFDPIVISAQVKKSKDAPEIFETALRLSGCAAEECVFIDNQAKNLVIPAKLGFKTYLFDPIQNDIPRLKSQLTEWSIQV